jgi:hypothetical protein
VSAERFVPRKGDDVEVVIRGTVEDYRGGNRVLVLRYGTSGKRRFIHYDANALINDGLTVRPALAAVPETAAAS